MIKNHEGFLAAHARLLELRALREKIESDPKLNHRQRSSELAGVKGLIAEIERDVRSYHLSCLQERLQQLQARAAATSPGEMPELVSQIIVAVQDLTQALQPAA